MSELERALIALLRLHGRVSLRLLCQETGATHLQVRNAMRRVVRERFALRVARGRYRYWEDQRLA
jgi:hypothetical protein